VRHPARPIQSTPIQSTPIGAPARDHAVIDAQLRRLALARWLFIEYGTERLRHQVMDVLDGLVDGLLDERLITREQR
jgi:hypothetical protein